MKGTIAIIVSIVVIVTVICVIASGTIRESVSVLEYQNMALQQAADARNINAAVEAANNLLSEWDSRFGRLAHLIPHEDLDKVSVSITRIWARVRLGDLEGLSVENAVLGEHLDHLRHKEEPSLENLL